MQRIAKNKMTVPAQASNGLEDCRELPHDYLLVGQGGIYTTPTLVQTVLGSCVSVTMYCSKYHWGGIFHALLPRVDDFPKNKAIGDHFRYVDSSIWHLLREFAKSGISAKSLECKVFGGASPLHQHSNTSAGNRNVKVAMEILAQEGVTVSASSVGGNGGRKLFFRTDTGLVLQKRFDVQASRGCGS
ncbi:MAG: chemotaxis protein CheD [Desulfomicrobium sp.]|nr:chemotaxis protein CheD [Desulfomicrobium sp.]